MPGLRRGKAAGLVDRGELAQLAVRVAVQLPRLQADQPPAAGALGAALRTPALDPVALLAEIRAALAADLLQAGQTAAAATLT